MVGVYSGHAHKGGSISEIKACCYFPLYSLSAAEENLLPKLLEMTFHCSPQICFQHFPHALLKKHQGFFHNPVHHIRASLATSQIDFRLNGARMTSPQRLCVASCGPALVFPCLHKVSMTCFIWLSSAKTRIGVECSASSYELGRRLWAGKEKGIKPEADVLLPKEGLERNPWQPFLWQTQGLGNWILRFTLWSVNLLLPPTPKELFPCSTSSKFC